MFKDLALWLFTVAFFEIWNKLEIVFNGQQKELIIHTMEYSVNIKNDAADEYLSKGRCSQYISNWEKEVTKLYPVFERVAMVILEWCLFLSLLLVYFFKCQG